MKFSDESTILSAIHSARQAGIVARANQLLIECRTIDCFLYCAYKTLQNLGCSGFAQFQCGESRNIKFGDTVRLHKQAMLQGAAICVDPPSAEQFTYRTEKILLIIDVEHCNPQDSDILKDNVAIFADSMESWLVSYTKFHQGVLLPMLDVKAVVDELNNVTSSLCHINDELLEAQRHVSEDLLSPLLASLPELGLDVEQENKILGIVSLVAEGKNKLAESQILRNIELRKIVSRAVSSLCSSKQDQSEPSFIDSGTVLFE